MFQPIMPALCIKSNIVACIPGGLLGVVGYIQCGERNGLLCFYSHHYIIIVLGLRGVYYDIAACTVVGILL